MALTKEFIEKKFEEGSKLSRTNPKAWVTGNYHEKAKVLPMHKNASCGHAEIEKYYIERNQADPNQEFEMCMHIDSVEECANCCGIVEGHFELKKKSDKSCVDHGKVMVILKKVGNDWKLYRVMMNTSKPRQ